MEDIKTHFIIRKIKKIIVTLKCRNNAGMVRYLNSIGAHIGNGCRFNCSIEAFGTEPYLITMGKNCLIAGDVHFITHDGGIKVLNSLDYFAGERMDVVKPIVIGDNVYIGMGAYIMPGVQIGDNVVIGARAIVSRDIPSNVIAVGTPAHPIKTIDEYYKSCLEKGVHPTCDMNSVDKKEFYINLYKS